MRTLSRAAIAAVIVAAFPEGGTARADDHYAINQNQTGINLPGLISPNGYDEVRAADGTTCRSSLGNAGAYLDSGVVGGGLNSGVQTLSAYGRLVVPLGRRVSRLDCERLYQLELRRLQLEVQLMERGLGAGTTAVQGGDWSKGDRWTNKHRR